MGERYRNSLYLGLAVLSGSQKLNLDNRPVCLLDGTRPRGRCSPEVPLDPKTPVLAFPRSLNSCYLTWKWEAILTEKTGRLLFYSSWAEPHGCRWEATPPMRPAPSCVHGNGAGDPCAGWGVVEQEEPTVLCGISVLWGPLLLTQDSSLWGTCSEVSQSLQSLWFKI